MKTLRVDDLQLELRGSSRRKTLQVTVDRGGELVLFAPDRCDSSVLEQFVRAKRVWIFEKLAQKDELRLQLPRKEYVSGEGFPYLGRSYRLLLVGKQDVPVKLEEGRFKMARWAAAEGRQHMIEWYARHAIPWLDVRVDLFSKRLGKKPTSVAVRELGYRWGSCGRGGRLYFHWKSVLLPPRVVEYIVVHELAHLSEPHHTPVFWQRVERAMPDFAVRKRWLAENGAVTVAV